jgi:hypothetical protein
MTTGGFVNVGLTTKSNSHLRPQFISSLEFNPQLTQPFVISVRKLHAHCLLEIVADIYTISDENLLTSWFLQFSLLRSAIVI